jgi:hypothetical protein
MDMEAAMVKRLVEQVFAPAKETAAWLEELKLVEVYEDEEGIFTLVNPHLNVHTAIYDYLDPISKAVCLGQAIVGGMWPTIWPGLLSTVSEEWKLRRRHGVLDAPPKPYRNTGKEVSSPLPKLPAQSTLQELFQPDQKDP